MPSYVPPKRATEFITYVALTSQANPLIFQSNPTLATGDAKVSIDGGAFANLTTLPAVTPGSSVAVKITLSIAEMTGDNIQVQLIDAAGAQWCDLFINIQTTNNQFNDLALSTALAAVAAIFTGITSLAQWLGLLAGKQAPNSTAQTEIRATGAGSGTYDPTTDSQEAIKDSAVTPAQVNEQVLDVVSVDVVAEASGVPAASTTLFGMVARLYGALRNSVTVNSSTGKKQYFNDAGAAQWEKDFTDDGTTYNETKGNAP